MRTRSMTERPQRDKPVGDGDVGWILATVLWVLTALPVSLSHASEVQSSVMNQLDFKSLRRPSSPNHWLVAPRDADPSLRADVVAPVLAVPAPQLVRAWTVVVEDQPRTRLLAVSKDGLQVEAEQRSAVFGFVDRISFRAVPVDQDRSTFYAYSRSQVGYWDVGVNRRRLDGWIGQLLP